MKILITSDWYSPAVNGVVTSVQNLRRELIQRGHEVRVLTLSPNHRSSFQDGVTRLGSIGAGRIYPGARLRTALAGKWVRELIDWKPDIVHSQCEFSTFFLARRITEELNIPLIHTYHTVYEDYTHYFSPSVRLGRKAVQRFTRWITAQTDCVIAPTEKVRHLLEGYQIEPPVCVVPSGIDLRKFQTIQNQEQATAMKLQMREKLGIPADWTILVCVGRLAEEKNIDELIRLRASMEKNKENNKISLLLVGDGPYRSQLEQQAQTLGLSAPELIFAGMVKPEEVADWYRLGDLFVSASSSETQGLTYIEALAAGVPVLCRADPCLTDVVRQGENGWQYQTESDFYQILNDFLTHSEIHADLQKNAFLSSQEFSAEKFAQKLETIYLSQIKQRQTGFSWEVPA